MEEGVRRMSEVQFDEITERVRQVLLSHGEPIGELKLARGMDLSLMDIKISLDILRINGKAQKGMRGWRAL